MSKIKMGRIKIRGASAYTTVIQKRTTFMKKNKIKLERFKK